MSGKPAFLCRHQRAELFTTQTATKLSEVQADLRSLDQAALPALPVAQLPLPFSFLSSPASDFCLFCQKPHCYLSVVGGRGKMFVARLLSL